MLIEEPRGGQDSRPQRHKAIATSAGRVESIHIAPAAGAAVQSLETVTAIEGVGLAGDRYASGTGNYSGNREVGRHLTLIEAEVLDDLRRAGMDLAPGESRRNVTTRGVGLNDLIGRRFRIGEVECVGTRLCEPCTYLEGLVGKPVVPPLVHRGGLRADIVVGGRFAIGDAITILD